jgi:hypothetical protein
MTSKLLVIALSSAFAWTALGQTAANTAKSSGGSGNMSSKSSSADAGNGSAKTPSRLASGTTINAVLSKPVDAQKCKPGDEVDAKVMQDVKAQGQIVIPRGSRLVGHVTEARAIEKGEASSASSLGIAFDRVVLKNGQKVPVHATIRALAAQQSNAAADAPTEARSTPMGGGGARNTAGHNPATLVTTSVRGDSSMNGNGRGALNQAGQLISNATGVIGLSGVQLSAQAANSTQGSVVTSTSKTVRLDSGTQMLLKVTGN